YEAYVLIKDQAWSKRLAHYAQFLPALQRDLPVPAAYKQETPGTDSDLNAYDVIYYAGDCNAGSKTIAINLPNDEEVQLKKGTRRLQLKNAMRAKYDKILVPIADMLIAPEQRKHVTFDAFFANTMFHEVAHGLGIKATLSGQGTVRQALRDQASALEEGKADVLGIYMATTLLEKNETTGGSVMDHYVTFMAGIFRSVRFGAASAHGRANMLRFNFFKKMGAFSRDSASGTYRVIESKMREAVRALSSKILRLQGDGDYVLQVKGNQPLLQEAIEESFADADDHRFARVRLLGKQKTGQDGHQRERENQRAK
ncbi:MAG: Zn-dependent hydrolase, partial [Planctomycetes bacterium]|nr:Zn-dependent hydrolase [Planctomycetota bacterium]